LAVPFRTYNYLRHRPTGKVLTNENLTQKFILSTTGYVVVMLKNALFCFPCLLVGGGDAWTKTGVTDLGPLPEKN
jgi:hypothetical protein